MMRTNEFFKNTMKELISSMPKLSHPFLHDAKGGEIYGM